MFLNQILEGKIKISTLRDKGRHFFARGHLSPLIFVNAFCVDFFTTDVIIDDFGVISPPDCFMNKLQEILGLTR